MRTITGGGSFTRSNINDINANFASVSVDSGQGAVDVWVRPQDGNNATADGSYAKPYATMAGLASVLRPGMVVGLLGVLQEEYSSPIVNDVTVVGMATQPRQATTSGVPNGGGATWLSPSSGTTHLAIVRGQGWRFQNIYFNNSTASKACIQILISGGGDPPADPSAEHTQILGCYFTGAKYGVLSTGGANFCTLIGNSFFGFADSGDTAVISETGAGVHSLYGWQILNNRFMGNAVHIDIASSGAEIAYNRLTYIDNTVTTTTQIDLTGGANNSVHDNLFDIPYSTNGITAMFVLGTNDRWYANAFGTAVTTTNLSWGQPSS